MHGIQIAGRMEIMVNRGWECAHRWINAIIPVHLASLGTCSEVAAHSFLLRSKVETVLGTGQAQIHGNRTLRDGALSLQSCAGHSANKIAGLSEV